VLDRSLTTAREMSVSVDGGLKQPYRLWYDKSRGRLYVGEWGGKRVIIIDHLKHFTATKVKASISTHSRPPFLCTLATY